ncbi:MAG: zinc-dependent alcohol dehydrogenase [Planctomycetota bacterium]
MKKALYAGNERIDIKTGDPLPPREDEVRVKVSHCGICGTDMHIFHGDMDQRVDIPQPIGHEMSGTVDAVGEDGDWEAGDRVTVRPLDPCGECPACQAGHSHICMNLDFLGIDTPGAMQGCWNVPAHTLHRIPESVQLKTAALIEPLAVACHDVRRCDLEPGEQAVVIGGGPIGILIALVARQLGANPIVLEINPARVELVEELGLEALNPNETDVVQRVKERTGGAGADVVFEVSATQAGISLMTELPRPRGRMVTVGICPEPLQVDLFQFFWRELQLFGARVYEPEDFEEAINLAASGELPLDKLITRTIPLSRADEAFQAMESGSDVMKILVACQE